MQQRQDDIPRVPLGVKIHMLRFTRGWTLKDLAEKSGIAQSTLSRYERGRSVPDVEGIRALAVAFETTPNALLDWDEATRAFLQGWVPANADPFRPLARMAS